MTEWFKSGLREVDEFTGRNVHLSTPRLLYIMGPRGNRPGESKRILVLDEDATFITKVHRRKWRGHWVVIVCNDQEGLTPGTCRMCKTGSKGKLRALLTVIDLDGFTSDNGREYRYLKRLMLADHCEDGGAQSCIRFLRWSLDQHGSLRGLLYRATQTVDRHGAVGDRFEPGRKLDLGQPENVQRLVESWRLDGPETLRPFRYERFLRPMSDADMEAFLSDRKIPNPQADEEVSF